MKKYILIPCMLLIMFLLFPKNGLAAEYSINQVKIEATLQKDGNVQVQETQTYSFDGKFNGITREIFPKSGTSIKDFQAKENGKVLTVAKKKNIYRIYRKGADESIVVNLSYMIQNGVDVYSDVAEFYWPFFDNRNPATYGNFTAVIHPPSSTKDVIAFGYEEAFKTEKVLPDGSVLFNLGKVPSEENGDIRVAYNASLFSDVQNIQPKRMKETILAEKNNMLKEAAVHAHKKEKLFLFGSILLLLLFIILFGTMYMLLLKERHKKADVLRNIPTSFSAPKQIMSLPATIFYTNNGKLPAEAMGAALLDLLRKGIIEKINENSFRLVSRPKDSKKHEQLLIDFLFYSVGKNGEFHFDDLKKYINKKKNHQKYHSYQMKWTQAVKEEWKYYALYEKSKKTNGFFASITVLLMPFLYFFPAYQLFVLAFGNILLIISSLLFALLYRPKTYEGLEIYHQWNVLQQNFHQITKNEWEKLSEEERIRIYIYGLGINNKNITRKNEALAKSITFPKINITQQTSEYSGVDLFTIYYFGTLASTNFYDANKIMKKTMHGSYSASSSSISSSGGGGVDGGGGGSGAF
ncbi:DUF2207 domain-containing protein [Niallia sp. 03133]|uniref:DUF2207 domain-containing protein n=1 Tax=Niallia sp. 03133 TaxID=3458060 RepID=UPI004043BE24